MKTYTTAIVVLLAGCSIAARYGNQDPTYQSYWPVSVTGSGYSTQSKLSAAESSENSQSQESSSKGYSNGAGGYLGYPTLGEGYDSSSKSASSSKSSRSLNKEDSTTAYNANNVAPGTWISPVGLNSGYSTKSKLSAAESTSNSQSQESSNKGYSSGLGGYLGYGGSAAEGYQSSKSAASSSRSLNKEDSTTAYNSNNIAPGSWISPVGFNAGYSTKSKLSTAESAATSQSQESSSKGYSNGLGGYLGYGGSGEGYQSSKSASSSKGSRSLDKEDSTTAFNTNNVAPGSWISPVSIDSTYSTISKIGAGESTSNSQAQESASKGYSNGPGGYQGYPTRGGGFDKSSKSSSSQKDSRPLNKESSTTAYNTNNVSPGSWISPVSMDSSYSTKSKIGAGESTSTSQAQESANNGYSNGLEGYLGYPTSGGGFDKSSKSSSSQKDSRPLNKESSTTSYNTNNISPANWNSPVGINSGYTTKSKSGAAELPTKSQAQDSSNKGYSNSLGGSLGYPTSGEGYDKSSKSTSASKDSGPLNKASSTTSYNTDNVAPASWGSPVGFNSGYLTKSKFGAAGSSTKSQVQKSSNKGSSNGLGGYLGYPSIGGGFDKSSTLPSSSKDNRPLSKEGTTTSYKTNTVAPGSWASPLGINSGYSTQSKFGAAESTANTQSPDSSNKAYSNGLGGYLGYPSVGGGSDKSSRSPSSSKDNRPLSKEGTTTSYNTNTVAPGSWPSPLGINSGYSTQSKFGAAESTANTQSPDSSNKAYSNGLGGYLGYPSVGGGSDKSSRSPSSSKDNRPLSKEGTTTSYNTNTVAPGSWPSPLGINSGYSTQSKFGAAESTANTQSQESSKKAYSNGLGGYLGYPSVGGGSDKSSRSPSSSKDNRPLSKEGTTTSYNTNTVAPGSWPSPLGINSGYSTQSKYGAAESTANTQSQESSNKAYSNGLGGYLGYPTIGAGYDKSSKSASSSQESRSLNKEDSTTAYNTNNVAPGSWASPLGINSGYSTKSKFGAAESTSNSQSQESSNLGYTNGIGGYLGYPTIGAGYDQSSKSALSSKGSRSLNKEDSTTAYNTNNIASGSWIAPLGSNSGYSTKSKLNAAESAASSQSQESSNKGYSNGLGGYLGYGGSAEGYQSSKSAASSSRSLNKEDSTTAYNANNVVPGSWISPVGFNSGYSTKSKVSAAESAASSQSQESSSKGYSNGLGGYLGYGGSAEGYQSSKSASSSSRSLNKEDSYSGYNQAGYPSYSFYGQV